MLNTHALAERLATGVCLLKLAQLFLQPLIITHGDVAGETFRQLASNDSVPTSVLEKLWQRNDPSLRVLLAQRPAAAPIVEREAAQFESADFDLAALLNPAVALTTRERICARLATSPSIGSRVVAAQRSETPKAALAQLAVAPERTVRLGLATHHEGVRQLVLAGVLSKEPLRRFASALHHECAAEQVVALATASTWTDAAAAALAPTTPSSTLEALGQHAHEVVRALARARRP
jgi:hypothetical protein